MSTLIIETAAGVKFTNLKSEFNKGGFAGYVRKTKGGLLFMDANKEPQAFMSRNDGGFFVTAFASESEGGKTRYMFGLSDASARFLGYTSDFNAADRKAMTAVAKKICAAHFPPTLVHL